MFISFLCQRQIFYSVLIGFYLISLCVWEREKEREREREGAWVSTVGPLPLQLFGWIYAIWSLHSPGISSYSVAVFLTLCHSKVIEFWHPAHKQASHILKIFFNVEQRSFLELLTVLLQKLPILPIKVVCCTVSSLFKSQEWLQG